MSFVTKTNGKDSKYYSRVNDKVYTPLNVSKTMQFVSASRCGFPSGFPCMAIWIKKGFKGETEIKNLQEDNLRS